MPRVPIVVILGATGTGKSKLAVQLAQKFNGEVISADSMQVYKGLDIASNKISVEEQCGIPHHMLDVASAADRFTVYDFQNRALPIINDILERKKLPILVGGTNYYIESVLWKVLVDTVGENAANDTSSSSGSIPTLLQNRERRFSISKDYVLNELEPPDEADYTFTTSNIDCRIRDILDRFEDTLKHLIHEVPLSFYKNTFYPVSQAGQSVHAGDDDTSVQSELSSLESEPLNVLDMEMKLIHAHIEACLESIDDGGRLSVTLLQDRLVNNFESAVETLTYNLKVLHRLLTKEPPLPLSLDNFSKRLQLEKDADSKLFKAILGDLMKHLFKVVNMRIRRIQLMGVADDVMPVGVKNRQLHSQLKLIDPAMAGSVHPNDRRKVIRSLQIFMITGKRHSDIIKEQRAATGGGQLGSPLRFTEPCVLWLQCVQEVLNERIGSRIKEMIDNGLVQEVEKFYEVYQEKINSNKKKKEYDLGILQTIGLKEFTSYLALDKEQRSSNDGQQLLKNSLHVLKIATLKYSKYQIKWIQNRFIRVLNKQVPPVYSLDGTYVDKWESDVYQPAHEIVEAYLKDNTIVQTPVPLEEADPDRFVDGEFQCDICRRTFTGKYQWRDHLKSKRHKKQSCKKNKRHKGDNLENDENRSANVV